MTYHPATMKLAAYIIAGILFIAAGIYWITTGYWLAGTAMIALAIGSIGLYRNT